MPKTLLLADDSVTIQKVVGISFANEDVELLTVDNGDDAVARAREVRPDVVLADVVMPGLNGYEVCEALKSDSELAHIPVLLLTGTFEAFDEDRARRVGANGHITKPFEAQALVDQVNALLATAAAPRPAPAAEPEPQAEPMAAAPVPNSGASIPAAPESGSDSGAFDFFEEESDASVEGGEAVAEAFDLDESESAFDFAPLAADEVEPSGQATRVVEDGAGAERPSLGASDAFDRGDETVALLPPDEHDDTWPSEPDDDDLADLDLDGLPAAPEAPADDATPDVDSGFEFGFAETEPAPAGAPTAPTDSDPLAGLDPSEMARENVLDPEAGDPYAVSSSDLDDPLEATAEPEPMDAPVAFAEEEAELPAPLAMEPAPAAAEPRVEALAAMAPAAGPAGPAPDLSPLMRQQLHESLEKIAWDAFADVSEKIVKQALERIEAIAWEVIPQMAEALVREEIRRMKGETE